MAETTTPFGLTLLIDKPLTWTSFDVVNKLRYTAKRALGVKKVKVGHAGTLDPLATGLMIVCFGSHTKRINELTGLDKTYEGVIALGATTPSYDLETEINQGYAVPPFDPHALDAAALSLTGEIDQVPPVFSAKKVNGKKAYLIARAGKTISLQPNRIKIYSLNLKYDEYPEIGFELRCSKGTYVRSLANDFGTRMGSGAYLKHLRRTRIGEFTLADALNIEEAMIQIQLECDKYLKQNHFRID